MDVLYQIKIKIHLKAIIYLKILHLLMIQIYQQWIMTLILPLVLLMIQVKDDLNVYFIILDLSILINDLMI